MEEKKTFGIKEETIKYIPGSDIRVDPDMEYLSFTKSHQISMNRLVREYSRHICKT